VEPIRILIVDDHPGLREGIRAHIESQADMIVVGEAIDGDHALRAFRKLRPDVTLISVHLPVICGIRLVRAIRAEFSTARTIVSTALDDGSYLREALSAGASGIVRKETLRRLLIPAIRAVYTGEIYLPADLASKLRPDR